MSARVAALRTTADELGISELEWRSFRSAQHSDALAFYVELRLALRDEYENGKPFYLPANQLAAQELLPGRHDRKHYLRLICELVRLNLIERVKVAGFTADGRREPAQFMFTSKAARRADNLVFLAAHRGARK
jgi:hypothetical protein